MLSTDKDTESFVVLGSFCAVFENDQDTLSFVVVRSLCAVSDQDTVTQICRFQVTLCCR